MKGFLRKIVTALTAAAISASAVPTFTTAASTDFIEGAEYIPNDIDMSYHSIFEQDGIEKVVRDSIIGGERSALFNDGWKFYKTSDLTADYSAADVNDSSWTNVTLPHDFQVIQTGNLGSRYSLLKDLAGWYKKTFYLPEELEGKRISIRFDGIYQDSKVFVNGQTLPEYGEANSPYSGTHYYGYKTFEVDLTDYLNYGESNPNVITVSVKDRHSSSRWYTGSGINRSVWLTVSDKVHVAFNGTYVSYELNGDYSSADVKMITEVQNETDAEADVTVKQTLYNDGALVSVAITDVNASVAAGETREVEQTFTVADPKLWGLGDNESENLYSLHTEVLVGGETADTYISEFGFRDIQWDVDNGVYFNGEHIKLQGVCMHENLGSLGSANNAAAVERQVVILKNMGVNAIRTAHNICTPELITICNRLGILVFEEAFDSWDDTKDGNYSLGGQGIFLDSYESDMRSMVRRDRNNPCVFMWSIGNEIVQTVWGSMNEAWPKIETMLDCIIDEDPDGGRFVTLAQMQWTTDFSQEISAKICDYLAENFKDCGVMSQNYREYYMQQAHDNYPHYRMLGTENSSAVRSRGVYHEGSYVYSHDDLQVSSLDNAGPAYYIPADYMYMFDMSRDWYGGEFIWSGFDYIGEPTPYDTKNSYFGIIDTAGLPKDIYYFYRSVWNTDEDTVHILPYWDNNDGDSADVIVYSNAEQVDLYYVPADDSGYEAQHLTNAVEWKDDYSSEESWGSSNKPEYENRLRFDFNLTYHPGTLYAVATYSDGHQAYTQISTPSDAAKIDLRADRDTIAADGQDMTFVEINTHDENGNLVALDSDRVKVEVTGAAELVSIDNGNAVDYDSYQSQTRKLFNGKAVAYIRSNGETGNINVKVTSVNMAEANITLTANAIGDISSNPEIKKSDTKPDSTLDTSISLGSTVYARKLEITPVGGTAPTLTEKQPTAVFNYKLLPENANASGKPVFTIIGTNGYVRANNASLSVDESNKTITVTGLKPGTFKIYGTYTNGEKQPQLLSTYTVVNESAVSDDPSLINDAYAGVNAAKIDSSSVNQSYTVDYDNGVIKRIYREGDTLVYKDVEFGTDYSRELILNCVNTASTAATVQVYVDDELKTTIVIPASEASSFSMSALKNHIFPLAGITGTHDITFRNAVQGSSLCVENFRFTGSGTDPYDAYNRIEGESYDYPAGAGDPPQEITYTDSTSTEQKALSLYNNCGAYYKGIDFGEEGSDLLEICMKRTSDSGNIAITIGDPEINKEYTPNWPGMDAYKEGEYSVYRYRLDKKYTGVQDSVYLFAYPGAATEIDWFRFVDSHGMLMNNSVINESDNYKTYDTGGTFTYGKTQLSAKFGSALGNNGIKVDVTDLIKSNPSGTELLASAIFTVSGSANAKLFLENQDGEKTVIGEITDKSAGSTEDAVIAGKIAYNYADDDTVYMCLTASSTQINLKKLALAYNAYGENYTLPGTVSESGENRIFDTTAKYSIKTGGTVSRDAVVSVMLDGEEISKLTYDSAEAALIGETAEDIVSGLYTVTYEVTNGTADITSLIFEITEQASKIELINNTFSSDAEKVNYTTYIDGDGTIDGSGNITVNGFASGYSEFNGIKTDITSKVKGLSGSRFGGSADVYTTANGEVKMFIEVVSADGVAKKYIIDSTEREGENGDVSLRGTVESVTFSDSDTVYLCITQWSGYTSFDNILLYYYAETKEETFFMHDFSDASQLNAYSTYTEGDGTLSINNGKLLETDFASGWNEGNGIKTDVTKYVKQLSGAEFAAAADVYTTATNGAARLFFEIVSSSGDIRTVEFDSGTDFDDGGNTALSGKQTVEFSDDDTIYLCITQYSGYTSFDNITLRAKYTGDMSNEKKTVSVFKHTFNAEKSVQASMYEPYEANGGEVTGANGPALKYTNSSATVKGIRINLTENFGLSKKLSGKTFGAAAQIQTGWSGDTKARLFFEIVSPDGNMKTVVLDEKTKSDTSTGEIFDSETGSSLGSSWFLSPLAGEIELTIGSDDVVYLCITAPGNQMWFDDISVYYVDENESKPAQKTASVFKHTFNTEKDAQVAMYEPYEENGGEMGGSYSTVLKYTNGSAAVKGIKINITEKIGLSPELSGKIFGALAQIQTGWSGNIKARLFFEIVSPDGSVKTVVLDEKTQSDTLTGEIFDSETGVSLGNSWFLSPLAGEDELIFGADDRVYLCITAPGNSMWFDDISVYYVEENEPELTVPPTTEPTATPEQKAEMSIENFDSDIGSGTVLLSEKVTDGTVIIAAYDKESSRCIGVKIIKTVDLAARIDFIFNAKNVYVKAFWWNSEEGMIPNAPAAQTE